MKLINPEKAIDYAKEKDYIKTSGQEEAVREMFALATVEAVPVDVLDKIRAEIEPKCDRINSLASILPYTAHREIQELLCEIMDLCKAESEDKE